MTEETKPKHSPYAPSASNRWLMCPGSVVLAPVDEEEGEPSIYALEGTVCHDIAATCLKTNTKPDTYLGQVVDEVNITQELVDGMQMYIDEVKNITREIGAKGGKVEFEVSITDECWGTLDFCTWNEDLAVFVDLKMGKGVIVDAEENTQLMLYAIGGLKYLQKELGLSPVNIRLYIIQPRTVNPVRTWDISRSELIRWFQDVVQPAMAKIKAGDTTCNPGTAQCRWCPMSATCEEQKDHVLTEAEGAFADFVPATEQGILSLTDLADLLPRIEHIQNWINKVKEYAMVEALSGKKIPGYKLVEGRSNRKWGADESEVAAFLTGACKIKAYKESLITPTQAEKELGKKKATQLGLDKYITKPPGKPTLVPASDTRPEMGASVEEEFKEFIYNPNTESTIKVMSTDDVIMPGANIQQVFIDDVVSDTEFIPDPTDMVSLSDTLIVDQPGEPKEVKQLSAWERLQQGFDLEEDVEVEVKADPVKELFSDETATGGNVVMNLVGHDNAVSPKAGTKRLDVLNMGKGGVTIKEAAKALGCTENMIKMHLRYLNEQNGWNVTVYDTGEFTVE